MLRYPFAFLLLTLSLLFSMGLSAALPEGYPDTSRSKESLNIDWKFSKATDSDRPISVNFDDSDWEVVCLPHNPDPVSLVLDNSTGDNTQKEFLREQNWYRKQVIIDLDANEKAFIEFEGVHSKTELWVNGQLVGRHEINGYIPHHFDITDFVKRGELNTIAINADNRFDPTIAPGPNKTDYVKWAGIYRDVYLVKTNKLHVNFNWESMDAGVHITTPTVNRRNGTVSVKTTVVNEYNETMDCGIETMIVDENGLVVKKMRSSSMIQPYGQFSFRQTTEIEDDFHQWAPKDPYLYRAFSVIYKNGTAVDFVENRFGFRKLELVNGEGLLLNGEPFFMVGVNRHQGFPNIGDAVPNSLHYEDALRYKQAGINAIRLSHYPQDDAFIDACDELGILLYEEPATWIGWDEGEWMDKLEQSLRVMIRNHRNHPSIAIWGAGINHRGPVSQLNNAAKEEDPWRFTATASSPWCGVKNAGVTDIFATMDYRKSDWPEEDFCLLMEHGFTKNAQANQFHLSRYKQRKNNIGALLWVGADYNRFNPGKDGEENDHVTEYGMMTAYRVKKPAYHWYVSELTTFPFVHIADESVYRGGKVYNYNDNTASGEENIHVYSNAPKVALYADGALVGIQRSDNDPLRNLNNHPSFTFRYHWTTEKLTAKALFDGEVRATHSRSKAGKAYALELSVDYPETPLLAGGSDLKMIRAFVVDANGEVITDATNDVHFEVAGEGRMLYANKAFVDQKKPDHGAATVYLAGTQQTGEITVTASSGGLKSSSIRLVSVNDSPDIIAQNAAAVFDYPIYKIDLNGEGNLTQFGWTEQLIQTADDLDFKLGHDNDIQCLVSSESDILWTEGEWAHIIGNLGFMGGSGCYVENGAIQMVLSGLDEGTYELKTYHHALGNNKEIFPYSIQVQRKDANGDVAFESDDEMVGYYDSKDTGEREPISVTNVIQSNGTDSVKLSFQVDKEEAPTALNGFILKRIR